MSAGWKIARLVVPIVASAAALVAVGYAIDWADVAGIALATPLWAVSACVVIMLAALAVAGLRLSLLAQAMGAPLSPRAAMSVWAVAHAAGQVLPTSVGNEVVKGGFLLRVSRHPVRVIGVLAIERLAATLALVLMVLVSVPIAAWRIGHPLALLATVGCGAALAFAVLAYLFRQTFFRLARRGARLIRTPEKTVDDMAVMLGRVLFGKAMWLSAVIHAGTVAMIAILLGAAGVENAVEAAILGAPLAVLASLAPISVGGFGVREGAFVLVFALFGVTAPVAASAGLAWWGVQTIAAIIACAMAVAWYVGGRRRPVAEAA